MKVLLLNGSPHQQGCTYTALCEVEKRLNAEGIETTHLWIGNKAVHGCIDCGKCSETGRCVFGDIACTIADTMLECDGIVVGSPVYYSGPNGALCAVLDRLFYFSSKAMVGKVGAAVVSCRRGGASATFDRLNKYFTINGMPVASSTYWNSVHGNTPDEVLQDLEGLQTMRNVGASMAWLLKAREGGEEKPNFDRGVHTNFIR